MFTTILTASALTLSLAASRPASEQARETFRDVEQKAHDIAVQADNLEMITRDSTRLAEGPMAGLDMVREKINSAGKELQLIDSERDSLPAWEQRTLDQVVPLLADAARNESQAIQYFNANRNHPATAEFRAYIDKIHADGEKSAKLLNEHLKLAKAKETETRIGQLLSEPAN
jgi:hypothetical protein